VVSLSPARNIPRLCHHYFLPDPSHNRGLRVPSKYRDMFKVKLDMEHCFSQETHCNGNLEVSKVFRHYSAGSGTSSYPEGSSVSFRRGEVTERGVPCSPLFSAEEEE
jgi:hypothetical protein